MTFVTLQAADFEFRDRVVRHQFFLGELSRTGDLISERDKEDATFDMRELSGNLVQFFAVNFPLQVLRHQDFRIKISELRFDISAPGTSLPETPEHRQTREDSIFAPVPGLGHIDGISFQATNIQGKRFFIRHRDFHLFLEEELLADPIDDFGSHELSSMATRFREDATFFIREPLVQESFPHVT